MKLPRVNEIAVIVGKKGYGKTKLAWALTAERKGIFFDITNSLGVDGLPKIRNDEIAAEVVTAHLNDAKAKNLVLYASESVYKNLLRRIWPLVDAQIPLHTTIIIDECQRYMTSKLFYPQELRSLIDEGRQSSLSLIFVARRLSEIHPYARGQADYLYTFRQEELIDLEILRKYSAPVEKIRNLPRDKYIIVRKP